MPLQSSTVHLDADEDSPDKSNCVYGKDYHAVHGAPSHLVHFKLHKVGGSSISTALACANYVNRSDLPDPAIACTSHEVSLPMAELFRQPSVLGAPNEQRVHEMRQLADPHGALNECPLPDDGRPLRTVAVLRDPVERLISKYYYEKTITMCTEIRNSTEPCAADVLPLLEWAAAGSKRAKWDTATSSWTAGDIDYAVACEPLSVLGGSDCSEDALRNAIRTMQSIDVVAITELLGVAAPLMERKLGLVPDSLVIPHVNEDEQKPNVSQKTRDALAQLPGVQHERELYGQALSRFRSELRAEGLPVPAV